MRAVIRPGRARGEMAAPPSKSMAHRLLLCAGLARDESRICGVDFSEDILATLDCLQALGARIRREGRDVLVQGCDPAEAGPALLPCRESGSTLRFLLPLCLLSGREMRLTGSGRLPERPLSVYEDICRAQGLLLRRDAGCVTVRGRLSAGEYAVDAGVSSQFVSGLLFALPLLPGDSVIRLLPPVESRSYLAMTLQALHGSGVAADFADDLTLRIPGGQAYRARDEAVEGDWSNAAFFLALNCLGGDIRLTGLREDSLQGDRVCLSYFRCLEQGFAGLDVSDCPDLAPVLFAVAAARRGGRFSGTRRLCLKESNRGEAMRLELRKFGTAVRIAENEITVLPEGFHAPQEALNAHGDHRIAMALAVLCAETGGEIESAEAVRKSLPDFWARLAALGVPCELVPV